MSGLPGTSGFVGEFLTLIGTFKVNISVATLATHRRDPVGLLCALALSQGDLRRARKARARRPSATSGCREIMVFAPLVVPDHPVRLLPEAGARHVGGLGDALVENYQAGARRAPKIGRELLGRSMRAARNERAPPSHPALLPALPEIVLAVGAMVLLMVGAYRGERSVPLVNWLRDRAAGRSRR